MVLVRRNERARRLLGKGGAVDSGDAKAAARGTSVRMESSSGSMKPPHTSKQGGKK